MKEWECVLDITRGEKRHPPEQGVTVRLRDPDTFETVETKAIIRSSFEEYPDADRLYYVSATKGRDSDAVPLEILNIVVEEEEEEEEVKVLPKGKLTLGQRRGTMLADMIKERKEKK